MSKILNELKNKVEDNSEKNNEMTEKLLQKTPCIPDDVYNNLPPIFDKIVNNKYNKNDNRIKDIMLLSSLTSFSSLFPKVSGIYWDKRTYANLYFFLGAKAGAGKSSIKIGTEILFDILEEEEKTNKKIIEEYYLELEQWELFSKEEKKENAKPIFPLEKTHIVSANITDSKLIDKIFAGSSLMFGTEADSLSAMMDNKQYGAGISSTLRMAWEHENISKERIGTGSVIIKKPKLSLAISGTMDQLFNILGKSENGLFSRFMIYTFSSEYKYKTPRPGEKNISRDEYIKDNIAEEVYKIYKTWNVNEQEYNLTEKQWDKFDKFSEWLINKLKVTDEREIETTLNRFFAMIYKVSMILTCSRQYESFNQTFESVLYPVDQDVNSAIKIVETVVEHMTLIYYSQEEKMTSLKENKLKKSINIIKNLNQEFNKQELLTIFQKENIGQRTLEMALSNLIKTNKIEKIDKFTYKKK